MICVKCKKEIPDESVFCFHCGRKQMKDAPRRRPKSRGNGLGSVYKLPNGTWKAVAVLAYEIDEEGARHRKIRSKSGFKTKKEALEHLPLLRGKPKGIDLGVTFKGLFDKWLPTHEDEVVRSTINCYKAAYKYYEPIWYLKFSEIGIDDLQECLDDCPKGVRTRQNMKALGTLLYKYALPRGYVPENLNFAQYLKVRSGEEGTREAFNDLEIEKVRSGVGKIPYADFIYCMIYTGYRPFEFLALDASKYDREHRCFVGGGKSEAGTDRTVTISPKIQAIVDQYVADKMSGPIFSYEDGSPISLKKFREDFFYPALEALGIVRPIEHKLTPYSTRHTFATLMKRVGGTDRDKLELMGHTSTEMLRHYQHVSYEDLQKITDIL